MLLRIGLDVSPESAHQRGVLNGITQYGLEQGTWAFRGPVANPFLAHLLKAWNPHGVVGYLEDPQVLNAVRKLGKPVVTLGLRQAASPFPSVTVDNEEVGRQGAQHLIDRQFCQFAFHHPYGPNAAITRRAAGFAEVVRAAGFPFFEEPIRRPGIEDDWHAFDLFLIKWVRSLPKPIGVMAGTDWDAWHLAEICRQAGVNVPSELAIVGAGNDEALCRMVTPSLSSVRTPESQIGYQAAALLDRCIHGQRIPAEPVILKPEGVVARGSSETAAAAGPDVLRAMGFIREHAHLPISVDDVVDHVAVSRRRLERQFRRSLDRSILNEITLAHLARARSLLIRTDLPINAVAQRSGLTDARGMAKVFHKQLGTSPNQVRHRHSAPRPVGVGAGWGVVPNDGRSGTPGAAATGPAAQGFPFPTLSWPHLAGDSLASLGMSLTMAVSMLFQ